MKSDKPIWRLAWIVAAACIAAAEAGQPAAAAEQCDDQPCDDQPCDDQPCDQVAGLIERLDADEFSERQEATQRLLRIGKSTLPGLRQALALRPSPETRWRIRGIILELTHPVLYTVDLTGVLHRIDLTDSSFRVRSVASLGEKFKAPYSACGLAWSQHGTLIAAVNREDDRGALIYEISPDGRETRRVVALENIQLDGLCCEPGGILFGITSLRPPRHHPRREGAGQLLTIDVEEGSYRVVCPKIGCGDLDALAIDSAGRALVTISNQGFYHIELDGGRRVKRSWPLEYNGNFTTVCGDLEGLAFTPRGALYGLLLDDDGYSHLVTLSPEDAALRDVGMLEFGAKNLTCAWEEE